VILSLVLRAHQSSPTFDSIFYQKHSSSRSHDSMVDDESCTIVTEDEREGV